MWQKTAYILIGISILVLIGWWAKVFFLASDIPLIVRIAVGAFGVGTVILLGVAIKDRRAKAKTENFKEVEK